MIKVRFFNKLLNKFPRRIFSHGKGYCQQCVTMKMDKEMMKNIYSTRMVLGYIFEKYSHEIRVVGGAVRDILMEKVPTDVDFATTAKPHELKSIFKQEGISVLWFKIIDKDFGFFKVNISGSRVDISSLRIHDLNYIYQSENITDNWKIDAYNRDFTINSMSIGMNGTIYDYCNGIEHLKNRQLIYIRNDLTIKFDNIRILRYFRFFGQISETGIHDDNIIKIIKKHTNGLTTVNGQLMYKELERILRGKFLRQNLFKMKECGIFPYIGLKHTFNIDRFIQLYDPTELKRGITQFEKGMNSEEDFNDFKQRMILKVEM